MLFRQWLEETTNPGSNEDCINLESEKIIEKITKWLKEDILLASNRLVKIISFCQYSRSLNASGKLVYTAIFPMTSNELIQEQ